MMRIVGGGDDDNQSGIGWHSPLTMVDKYHIVHCVVLYSIVKYWHPQLTMVDIDLIVLLLPLIQLLFAFAANQSFKVSE